MRSTHKFPRFDLPYKRDDGGLGHFLMTDRFESFGEAHRAAAAQKNPDRVDDPVLAFFLSYWREKLRGRTLPLITDFVPKEVRGNLRWVVLIDVLQNRADFRYRLVGSSVCEYFLGDGTGKTVAEAFAGFGELAVGIAALYRRVCELACPIRVTGPATVVNDVFFPAYDSLYLPYSNGGRDVDRIVNAFVFNQSKIRGMRPFTLSDSLLGSPTIRRL
jgi:PAS domain-containing protein